MSEPDGRGTATVGEPRRRPYGTARFVRDVLVILLAALLISFLLKTFLVRSFYIPSGSMMNTLQIDDRIVVDELAPKVTPLKRGDVIVFTDPGGWLPVTPAGTASSGDPLRDGASWLMTQVGLGAGDSDDHLVKRVIGLPGDTVSCCTADGQTKVNGVALDEPYVRDPATTTETENSDKAFSITVPAGSVWVEGDNRGNSDDSRFHQDLPSGGFVPLSEVVGKAFVITWPIRHWTHLGDYPDVFRKAAAAAPGAK